MAAISILGISVQERATQIGHESVSAWVEVSQAMIDKFADATLDYQFIHIDTSRAAETPFGGTIAHGFLTLSLLSHLAASTDTPKIEGVRMGVNYGCNKVRFITPVRSGKRIRARFVLRDLTEKRPGQWQQVNDVTVEIEGEDKPALIAEWIGQFFI